MLELFMDLNRKERNGIKASVLCFTLAALAGAGGVYTALKMVFGIVNGTVAANNITQYWVILAGLIIIQTVGGAIGSRLNHLSGFALVQRLREAITLKLQKFSLAFYTKEQLSEVSSVIHKDVDTMEMVVAHLWSRMFSSILVSIILAVVLFSFQWQLALGMFAGIPIALLTLILGTKKREIAYRESIDDNVEMLDHFLDFTKGMSVLKSYKKNDLLQRRLNESVVRFGKISSRLAKIIAFVSAHYLAWLDIIFAIVVTFGAYIALGDKLSVMEYIIFVVISKEFFKPFIAAEGYYVNYIMVKESFGRIQRIMNSPILSDVGTEIFPANHSVTFNQVGFTYTQNEHESFTISGINITVPEGTLTALVGPSGSGKTTLTNLLLRFYEPDSGSICIGGTDIRDMAYDTLLTHIAVVMQDVFVFSGTIYDNLLMGNEKATEEEIMIAAKQAMIHDEIIAMPDGYRTVIGERGTGLSGGQRQRLSIARAFLKNAKIIILDEATSNVDPINEHRIQQAISNLAKNRTVIVIAHHLRTIRNADQIVVLQNGSISEKGKHEELLKNNELYSVLWEAQI
jgi:ATP-binding cassette subfamily B protein IrtB